MLSELLEKVVRGLESRGVPYMVIGGQAVLVYGEPRMTRDIDITLGMGPEGLPKIEELSRSLNLRMLTGSPEEFVRDRMILPCEDTISGFRIDFVFSFTPFERQAIERARVVGVGGTGVRFATPEDLIIHKMVAGRPRDEEDVRGILLKTSPLDGDYIEGWLAQFDEALGRRLLERFRNLCKSATG
jgi:predicted nucleotidyltransferase